MAKKNDFFQSICKVSRAFGTTLDKDEILKLIVESAIKTMKGKAACLWLVDEGSNELRAVAQKGLSDKYFHTTLRSQKIVPIILKEGYLYAHDATTDDRLEDHEGKKAEGIASILIVPVMVKGKAVGVLSLYTSKKRDFSKDEIGFLTALAEQGGMAIEHARLFEKIMENTRLFYKLAANINATLDVKEIMHILSSDVAEALGVKAASVRLLGEDKETLELVASYGLSEKFLEKGPISAKKSISQALSGEVVAVKNAAKDERIQYKKEMKEEGVVSMLSVPIKSKDEVLGVLRLYSASEREFTEDEVMLASALALQGGVAIQNASMYLMLQEDMRDLKEDIWSHRSWF
jgi:GAF domain-containing protein